MDEYDDKNRKVDFDFFVKNYDDLYKEYGHKFLAIKDKKVLGAYESVPEAIELLSDMYKVGTYSIQECSGDDSAYRRR